MAARSLWVLAVALAACLRGVAAAQCLFAHIHDADGAVCPSFHFSSELATDAPPTAVLVTLTVGCGLSVPDAYDTHVVVDTLTHYHTKASGVEQHLYSTSLGVSPGETLL
jgi:hypothetical protein